MTKCEMRTNINCDVQKVWKVVTNIKEYAWRSDLSKVDIVDECQFIEYTRKGYATTFSIIEKTPCSYFSFTMENNMIKGHWSGRFIEKGEQTEIIFTEDVTAKKLIIKPFIKSYLKKQQNKYISDLQEKIDRIL
ncbi:hypothetical protein M2475_000457 [Breznakia sp. PF5-3]|uniref:SRPBCC family protein n=1 Tax=unclassified Breznakia TaxID=2623764 RepID=UPI002405CF6A|nr:MULTISPECIES: SRPBCC family protein [unclassified Breznakia]MDF9824107.1 hypothetical protein [Breznakia sp. PM6-1]MDF9834905.1 hypothetical protein [Breznakia sp. PF5-3]MDF9837226.1 hypothetical protein [Breznakia sp. PFB2-8]MDF9859216.1 hypothetical protein [Breznakia sp. PH5-24]